MPNQQFEDGSTENDFTPKSKRDHFQDSGEYEIPKFNLKVSGKDDCRILGKKIADACRSGDPPALLTIGNASINQSVKGIAVARQYLRDSDVDLTFQPAFRDADRTRALIAFYVMKTPRANVQQEDDVELAVASNSRPSVVAGAIAARVREQKSVCLMAMGVDAVAAAVLSIGNARCYLEQDNLDIRVVPEFVHVVKNGDTRNVMKMRLLTEAMP